MTKPISASELVELIEFLKDKLNDNTKLSAHALSMSLIPYEQRDEFNTMYLLSMKDARDKGDISHSTYEFLTVTTETALANAQAFLDAG